MKVVHMVCFGCALLLLTACAAGQAKPTKEQSRSKKLARLSLVEGWEGVVVQTWLTKATIPTAKELGLVEVERRKGVGLRKGKVAWGWHCANKLQPKLTPEGIVDLGALGTAPYATEPDTAAAHFRQIRGIQGSLPQVTTAHWRDGAVKYLTSRFRAYETHGKPIEKMPRFRSYAWRSWMRDTMVTIRSRAKDAGWSNEKATRAVTAWVYCHLGADEWTELKNVFAEAESTKETEAAARKAKGEN